LGIIGICLVNAALGAAVYAGILALIEEPESPAPAIAEEDFAYEERSYDIDPGQTLVLYTNYACPFCAGLFEATSEVDVTTRILLVENQSNRFASQDVVSPYMLKLSREDYELFKGMQATLYQKQNDWTDLSDSEVIVWLNEESGQNWDIGDLSGELEELRVLESEAPSSLLHVPSLYLNNNKVL
jgi:hypothetical protein